MLVLSRNKDQSIHIGDDIVIRVLDIRGANVRIGIEAPREIKVLRNECLDQPPQPER
ncbi:CsrA RNA-binding global regulator CsrA [uncultured Caudovirales phage]|uniref:CsrA RNA-binding global regulator CsrA n=1 Tax=uncultured Caudovirales phage TaxID=2100421 RepID=A0A6J5LEH7_9CAUD|nr:CsrA RNA-binding global regulator CsrA [uncultured Caudovirales phage]